MKTSASETQRPGIAEKSFYDEKQMSYYGVDRPEVLRLIPTNVRRLLDVGCGSGATGYAAKQLLGAREVIGIELFEAAAQMAKTKLDQVIVGDIEQLNLNFPQAHFDCILCADVLEHTKDPWKALRTLRNFLHDDGVLIASIPNIRHVRPLFKIVFDRFEYEESGILDKTHLRFFTLHTIKKMLSETGFQITKIDTNWGGSWKSRLFNICTLGLLQKFLIYQFLITAKKA
ncbi:MAG: class I SAM-dependent methyltransferase, partial [Ignavibacteriales bacterium]|nr:class I SAM-dependent methyltransferase [Ignavibacteriales bacterium]